MRSVVFVCHYFPPQENVGVRRVLFWANYLVINGFDVTVVTTKKHLAGNVYDVLDERVKVVEVGFFNDILLTNKYDKNKGKRGVKKYDLPFNDKLMLKARRFKQKFINKYLGQLFDNRIPLVLALSIRLKISSKKMANFLPKSGSAVLISTAPPWPIHFMAMLISKRFNYYHIVDYRDPFSNNHIFSGSFNNIETFLDQIICNKADLVTTVSPSWASYYIGLAKNVLLLRNGFDSSYFDFNKEDCDTKSYVGSNFIDVRSIIVMSYFGSIEVDARVPKDLIYEVLKSNNINLQLHFYGNCSSVLDFMNDEGLISNQNKIFFHGFVPYEKTMSLMQSSNINIVSESFGTKMSHLGLIPTKIYEYMASLKPIIVISNSNSDMIKVVEPSGLLFFNANSDSFDYSSYLNYDFFLNYRFEPKLNYIKSFSRQNVALDLSAKITEILKDD
ncbi:MAG: hypothetical protein ABF331_08460 [Hellea sp.]